MTENLTRKYNLVQEITDQGWFANPAGKQGYEVVLLEKVGKSGTRYYTSLKPGDTLRIAERLLISYIVLQVDIRHARAFPVSGAFNTRDRGKKVSIGLNVRFHVSDARIVAMETVDPLEELQSKVLATLNRELQGYSEHDITVALIERLVQNIGQVPHLGLAVEDVEVISFDSDSRITQHVVEEENVHHSIRIDSIRQQANLDARKRDEEVNLEIKTNRHGQINLSDLNVFMHEFPDLATQVLATFSARDMKLLDAQIATVQTSILNYIEQQKGLNGEIDPREISNMLRDAISSTRPRLPDTNITWGDESPSDSSDSDKSSKSKNEKKDSDLDKDLHIKFGE